MKLISIVVPMYNEEEMAPIFFVAINKVIGEIKNYRFELMIVNDGSRDKTLDILKAQREKQNNIHIVSFSRNFGHEAAVAAGMKHARGDALIVMDADLQDPPELIIELLKKYEEGYEVVNAKRVDRKSDGLLKRKTAEWFYKIISKLSGKIKIPENIGNYRLVSRRVADKVNELREKNHVFRVVVPFAGYKTTEVEFVRKKRPAGQTHYNYKAMFRLAGDSITSSSIMPLRYAFKFGFAFMAIFGLISILFLIFEILTCCGATTAFLKMPNGTIAIIGAIGFFVGVLLIFIGIIGEYLGKVMIEIQDRTFYEVDEEIYSDLEKE